jgi:hypothetical protein
MFKGLSTEINIFIRPPKLNQYVLFFGYQVWLLLWKYLPIIIIVPKEAHQNYLFRLSWYAMRRFLQCPPESTHRVAFADFWRTSHSWWKISPGWWGLGVRPPLFAVWKLKKALCRGFQTGLSELVFYIKATQLAKTVNFIFFSQQGIAEI